MFLTKRNATKMYIKKKWHIVIKRLQSVLILFWLLITHIFKKLKTRRVTSLTILAVLCCIAICQTDLSPDLYFINLEPLDDVSCHYTNTEETLPSADWSTFSPPTKSIFFHETSCKGDLDYRQACAVESAARAHPNWQINVLFAAPVTNASLNSGTLAQLKKFPNVKLARIHLVNYAKGTPLESMVAGGALNRSRWRFSHTSDALRYLSLYKWGGVYLDLDVVVAKPLGALARNWAARESDESVSSGALAFSEDKVGRTMAKATIRDLMMNYRGDTWGQNGPGVITRVLRGLCSETKPNAMSADTCDGFEVYGPQFFYPIKWESAHKYFESGTLNASNAYVYHVWNRITHQYKVMKDCPYAKLARTFCPTIFTAFGNEFGVQAAN